MINLDSAKFSSGSIGSVCADCIHGSALSVLHRPEKLHIYGPEWHFCAFAWVCLHTAVVLEYTLKYCKTMLLNEWPQILEIQYFAALYNCNSNWNVFKISQITLFV